MEPWASFTDTDIASQPLEEADYVDKILSKKEAMDTSEESLPYAVDSPSDNYSSDTGELSQNEEASSKQLRSIEFCNVQIHEHFFPDAAELSPNEDENMKSRKSKLVSPTELTPTKKLKNCEVDQLTGDIPLNIKIEEDMELHSLEAEDSKDGEIQKSKDENLALIFTAIQGIICENKKINARLSKIEARQQEILNLLQGTGSSKPQYRHKSFYDIYKLVLPFKTLPEFLEFDQKLKDDKDFESAFIDTLHTFKNSQHEPKISLTLSNIIKRYMAKEVACLYSGQGRSEQKHNFSITSFGNCILKSLLTMIPNSTERAVKVGMTNVLATVKDWDTRRKHSKVEKDKSK